MAYQCWTCGAGNANRKALMAHGSKIHQHLAVICPYCIPKEHLSNRVSDLKRHIQLRHPGLLEGLPEKMLTERNGFYLCINPYDYSRHCKPTSLSSPEAVAAMDAVRLCNPQIFTPTKSLAEWEQGWLQAIATPIVDEPLACLSPTDRSAAYSPCTNWAISPARPTGTDTDVLSTDIPADIINVEFGDGALLTVLSNDKHYQVKLCSWLDSAELHTKLDRYVKAQLQSFKSQIQCQGTTFLEISAKVSRLIDISDIYIDVIYECSTAVETLATGSNIDLLKSQVKNVLLLGAMPLVPPAKREWDSTTILLKNAHTQQSISWPPADWKSFPADRKLLCAEYAAMKLDEGPDGYPSTPRDLLMDTYMFLQLPGSTNPHQINMNARQRFMNFRTLRDYLKGGPSDKALVGMLVKASECRSTMTDVYTKSLTNIPLRI